MNQQKIKGTTDLYDHWNFTAIGVALAVIVAGYICLAQKPVDGTLTMVVAPVLLVIGYCVLVPVALFVRPRREAEPGQEKKL